jgi:hypothetical protein
MSQLLQQQQQQQQDSRLVIPTCPVTRHISGYLHIVVAVHSISNVTAGQHSKLN